MKRGKYRKVIFEPDDIAFIRKNFDKMTNPEIARALGCTLTILRNRLREMGLKRIEMEYWTEEQVQFLLDNFRTIGDVEMAEIFEERWPKNKTWTCKHIRKKRVYLNLHRTKAEIKAIKRRNTDRGCFDHGKTWETRGVTPVGEIRVWNYSDGNEFAVIKRKGGFVHYNRWLWKQHFGPLRSDQLVVTKSGETKARGPGDLEVIDRSEHARRNTARRYPEEVQLSIKLLRQIQSELNQH